MVSSELSELKQTLETIIVVCAFIGAVWVATPKGFAKLRVALDWLTGWHSGYRWDDVRTELRSEMDAKIQKHDTAGDHYEFTE